MENIYSKGTRKTILSILNNCIARVNGVSKFITQITEELQNIGNTNFKRDSENDFCSPINYKFITLNEEILQIEQIENNIKAKISRKNRIEHYFNVKDKQLQFAMKKKMTKSEAFIVVAMKEHDHKMINLQLDAKNLASKIELNKKSNEKEKNNLTLKRNNLKTKKAQIVHTYDTEMLKKYKNLNELNSKIKMIEDNINQLQESILLQTPLYNEVILEKEKENDRIWHEQLYEIQRKIAARKIQMHFRRYLAFIKTRDTKKNKKGQHKKLQSKIKNN